MKRSVKILGIFLFCSAVVVYAGGFEEETTTVEIQKADRVIVNCDLGAGEFRINPGDISEAAIVDVKFDPKVIRYDIDSDYRGSRCYIDMESDVRRHSNIDSEGNVWDIQFSTRYPLELDMDIGACEAEFELGGIPLEEFNLDIGAASGEILFSEPNPSRLEEIEIDAGASSLTMEMIGNANFKEFSFSGGAGSFDLDFRGKYNSGTAYIDIDVGLGSGDIILPKDVSVRIEYDGSNWFSSVDIDDRHLDDIDDGILESRDFEDADTRIVVRLNVGMGSLDVKFR
ncbi:MAG: hypothetical protein DWP97_00585 [Calditrichaeota bacterium]|nr:MAG: hypothetical protein DWP97_00585 [Calditrichota bacterium]